jgi:hypothetical protein
MLAAKIDVKKSLLGHGLEQAQRRDFELFIMRHKIR